ncbi:class I mannose-6-phosphate isomerase [Neorhizobium sp. DAR64861/K0K2]|uniref:class I mannose-6-phosphate isomerase n=1 Tax=unclassified Neorhizobium TaxID=2629175 RepID=UPI003D28FC02
MTVEHLGVQPAAKPWGRRELKPWSQSDGTTVIGELRYARNGPDRDASALLLKLLFTSQALSIQVHPDDAAAQGVGMRNGKTEAWYVLSADDGAEVGIGLKTPVSTEVLRDAISDGSIGGLLNWQKAYAGDAFFVPAGTIHAIGAGLVIAEIQQASDTTYRLFDYGSARELHIEQAVSVAQLGPAPRQEPMRHLTKERTLLVSCDFFVLERVTLAANTLWQLRAESECWLLLLAGEASIGSMPLKLGDAVFLEAEDASIRAGADPITALLAFAGKDARENLLREVGPLRDMPDPNTTTIVQPLADVPAFPSTETLS